MIEDAVETVKPGPSDRGPFDYEADLYKIVAELILFVQDQLKLASWSMKPSKGYLLLYNIILWFRKKNIWHFNQPAFLYVLEELKKRANDITETFEDEAYEMYMEKWVNRKPPVAGGKYSILQIFDWFMPSLRILEELMVEYYGNPNKMETGKEFTPFEAVNSVFSVVDRFYKDPHFGAINSWGQPKAFPWVATIRNEMFRWREALKPSAPPVEPGTRPPFSMP